MFSLGGFPVYLRDAAELLLFATLPPNAVLIVISRSGRSIEIVNLLAKARESGATVIGITNVEDGTLAREAQIPLVISTNWIMQFRSTLTSRWRRERRAGAPQWVRLTPRWRRLCPGRWRNRSVDGGLAATDSRHHMALPSRVYYFLARGPGLGSCNETRLMWEEGVKSPATAMDTGSFRHGP